MKLPTIQPGAGIGVVAPGEWVRPKDIQSAVDLLKEQGYRIYYGNHLFDQHRYFSGTVAQRVSDIHQFLYDKKVQAIYAARGGVGSAQLLPHLDWQIWQKNKKLLIGFSDITALQWGIWGKIGVPSISGMTLTLQLQPGNPYLSLFFKMLSGKHQQITAAELSHEKVQVARSGTAEGILMGGTLTIINSLLGTPYFPQFDQPLILFLEDVKEPLYRLERLLVQLQQAGVLRQVAGLILGRFLWQEGQHSLWPIVEYLFPPDIPVIVNFPYGHFPDSCPLPVGVRARLQTDPFILSWN